MSSLSDRPECPTLEDYDTTWKLQRHTEAVEHRISQGVLPADEDAAERRAFWNDKLLKLRTPDGHAKFSHFVTRMLASPRDRDIELKILDAFVDEGQRELVDLAFEPIRQSTGTDTLSRCFRWRALAKFGEQFITREASGQPISSIEVAVAGMLSYGSPDGADAPPEVVWARRLRDDTEGLRMDAEKSGFSADARVPISKLVQATNGLLAGNKVNLAPLTQEVDAIVDEVAAQARRSPNNAADRLYQVVVELHRTIERIVALIDPANLGHGLYVLDRYLYGAPPTPNERWPGGRHDIQWRTTVSALQSLRTEADDLWSSELGTPPRTLHRRLTLVGRAPAKLAMLDENSHHGLVLSVARLFLDGITKLHSRAA